MFFYQILIAHRLPVSFLVYKSERELQIGRVIEVSVRNKLLPGVVVEKLQSLTSLGFDENKVKQISNLYPFSFEHKYLQFIKTFSYNSFNDLSDVVSSNLQFIKFLTKKHLDNLNKLSDPIVIGKAHDQGLDGQFKIDYELNIDITLRIIYLIRSMIETPKPQQILLLFPENKYLNKIYKEIKDSKEFKQIAFKNKLELNQFTASNSAKTSRTLESILKPNLDTVNIVFGTRSSIFLPFTNLSNVIVVDETNLMYIQDQNNLYYDTREAVFILCSILQCNLNFVGQLPSIRLLEMYSEKSFDDLVSNYSSNSLKLPKIKITRRNRKVDQFEEFSDEIQELLSPNQEL